MSISQLLSRFSGGNNTAPQAQAQAQAQAQGQPQGQLPAQPGQTMQAQNSPQPQAPEQIKLEDFGVVFNTGNSQQSNQSATPQQSESMYPDFLAEDFKKNIQTNVKFDNFFGDQVFAALQQGNPQAFRDAMNSAMQTMMLYTFAGFGKLTEEGLSKRLSNIDKQVESKLSRTRVEETLNSHPVLSNPALNPVRTALTESFTSKYPQATQQEIKAFVDNYLLTLAETVKPTKPQSNNSAQATDWANFL